MSGLGARVVSAIIAGFSVFAAGFWGGPRGLTVTSLIVLLLGLKEYGSMAFPDASKIKPLRHWFLCCGSLFLISMAIIPDFSMSFLCSLVILFFCGSLWHYRGKIDNTSMMTSFALGSLGFLYFITFPGLVLKSLTLPHGSLWFTLLLLLVFFGDTFAYFGGRFFGKHPLMPEVSPNKTVEGLVAGLLGSVVASCIFMGIFLPTVPIWVVGLFALICGCAAHTGDLLVSLVKRVAQVKDSGKIMPGHGGILDRLDGVYMASPLVFAFARFCEITFLS